MDLKKLSKTDPVKRNVEKGLEQVEHTPMDPPSAYDLPGKMDTESIATIGVLKTFMDEHKNALSRIEQFEQALIQFKANGYKLDTAINEAFRQFFNFLDNDLLPHNRKEEKTLFPVLQQKLLKAGEHSTGEKPLTAIDVMEDDHVKFIQLGALTFNFLGLATRIKDENSRIFVLDTAYENGRELVELLKLHIFREDVTLFPLAGKYISSDEFVAIEMEMQKL